MGPRRPRPGFKNSLELRRWGPSFGLAPPLVGARLLLLLLAWAGRERILDDGVTGASWAFGSPVMSAFHGTHSTSRGDLVMAGRPPSAEVVDVGCPQTAPPFHQGVQTSPSMLAGGFGQNQPKFQKIQVDEHQTEDWQTG